MGLLKLDQDLLLPTVCWYRSKTNLPKPMHEHTSIAFHKISGKNLFPDDPFNLDRIVDEIMVPYRVSYHLVITREPSVRMWVPFDYQSFHAGLSRYQGREYCNNFMIGIGLLSTGIAHQGQPAYLPGQIELLAQVSAELMDRYPINDRSFTSHEFIRNNWNKHNPENPGQSRQGDPGGNFPWANFRKRLASEKL
ncbi:MAG: hypothetical protein BMS9Abin02_1990 [Anaerolineae bacterium]|nr:MAG: hypothetical protein BMS9Abin02_1990 [Anaerolineae bacterium]